MDTCSRSGDSLELGDTRIPRRLTAELGRSWKCRARSCDGSLLSHWSPARSQWCVQVAEFPAWRRKNGECLGLIRNER